MPSTTTSKRFRRGQAVVVNVPFSDQMGSKRRPALIVSDERFHRALPDVIVCPISSQPRYYQRPGPGDCPLRHWQAVGLRHPSTVRISNLVSIEKGLIHRVLGAVRADDLATVAGGLREAFGLLREVRRVAERPTLDELRRRLAGRAPVIARVSSTRAVRAGRNRA